MLRRDFVHFFLIPPIIGLIGGISAVAFRFLIFESESLFKSLSFNNEKLAYIFAIPIIFLISHLLSKVLFIDASNVTIDSVARRILIEKGGFNPKKGLFVLLLTSFNIGFGVPVGREGPIAKLGGVLSGLFCKLLKFERINLPIYLTCGVSSALSATFNAPIASIIFGLEIILGKVNTYVLIPLIVSCGTASFFARHFLGDFTAFDVPELACSDEAMLLLPVAGIFFSIFPFVFTLLLDYFEIVHFKLRRHWGFFVLIFGAVVGVTVSAFPEIAGVGYESVEKLFFGEITHNTLLIAIAKLFCLILSFGSGVFGGVLAPSIFIGAFSGYWLGEMFNHFIRIDPRVIALVGTAAILSGTSRAPFRSSIIIMELTHSYQLILPILLTSTVTAFTISTIKEHAYFSRSLLHKGIDISDKRFLKAIENVRVDSLTDYIKPIGENMTISLAIKKLLSSPTRYLPVVKGEKLVGIFSLRDLRFAALRGHVKVKDVMTENPFAVPSDATGKDIIRAISLLDVNFIPVVGRDGKYLGMLNVDKFMKVVSTEYSAILKASS